MTTTVEQRKLQLCQLEELRLFSDGNARLYKERTKQSQDKQIQQGELIPAKLKSRRLRPFKLTKVYPHGAIELQDEKTSQEFKVN